MPVRNYVVGLGGRDIRVKDYEKMFENLVEGDNEMEWINVGVK